jgi:hypothetical protein
VLRAWDDHYYDIDRPVDAFVAWPPPVYVPYQVVYPLWSFSYPDANFSQATVALTKDGMPVGITRYPSVNGWGENTIVWRVGGWSAWPKPAADSVYHVRIQNVRAGSKILSFAYKVTIFDPGP